MLICRGRSAAPVGAKVRYGESVSFKHEKFDGYERVTCWNRIIPKTECSATRHYYRMAAFISHLHALLQRGWCGAMFVQSIEIIDFLCEIKIVGGDERCAILITGCLSGNFMRCPRSCGWRALRHGALVGGRSSGRGPGAVIYGPGRAAVPDLSDYRAVQRCAYGQLGAAERREALRERSVRDSELTTRFFRAGWDWKALRRKFARGSPMY